MNTKKNQMITIEVKTAVFQNTKIPFLVGDWIKAEKVKKVTKEGRYFLQEKESHTGVFRELNPNSEISNSYNLFKLHSVSRFI